MLQRGPVHYFYQIHASQVKVRDYQSTHSHLLSISSSSLLSFHHLHLHLRPHLHYPSSPPTGFHLPHLSPEASPGPPIPFSLQSLVRFDVCTVDAFSLQRLDHHRLIPSQFPTEDTTFDDTPAPNTCTPISSPPPANLHLPVNEHFFNTSRLCAVFG